MVVILVLVGVVLLIFVMVVGLLCVVIVGFVFGWFVYLKIGGVIGDVFGVI